MQSEAFDNKQLKNKLEKKLKMISNTYRTNLYGFEFGEVAEKQGEDMLPSMKTHCARVHCA